MYKSLIIGVTGGSGSGKTTFAKRLSELLGPDLCTIIGQDSYYIDQSSKFDKDGGKVNFDHPDAIDFNLLEEHIISLKNGRDIAIPIYDFATHKRISDTQKLTPHPIILIDGILILSQENIRKHFDEAIFMDVPEEVRFDRRLNRDVNERGRTALGVYNQFINQVQPMHEQFVEPSKKFASKIVTTESFMKDLNKFADFLRSKFTQET
jgi:uridine kinase